MNTHTFLVYLSLKNDNIVLKHSKKEHTHRIKSLAHSLGFSFVGIAEATELTEEARRLEQWLNKGYHGKMQYMENHFEKRIDPRKLVPGAKSVVTMLYNYQSDQSQVDPNAPKISKYAYGTDYHFVVKDKLKTMMSTLEEDIGAVNGRCFVDSAPVLERAWAERSGLGWNGKHTLMINKGQGSFFFIAVLIIDLDLEYDAPLGKDYCGTCRKCIDACPTGAIKEGRLVDGSSCISYLTIELKDEIPAEFKGRMENWMFGCDVCQDVCPWNRFSKPHEEPKFKPHEDLLQMDAAEWEHLTEEVYRKVFKKSPVKRTKYLGIKRNIEFLLPDAE